MLFVRHLLRLSTAWLPIWALFFVLLISVHQLEHWPATVIATRSVLIAALLGLGVYRLTQFWPWPKKFKFSFWLTHALAAAVYAGFWLMLNHAVTYVVQLHLARGTHMAFALSNINILVTGFWLYLLSASVSYIHQAQERAAKLELANTQAELAQLRAQLHPHFLFNALHSITQLISEQPKQAANAVETLADLLRHALDTQQDWISLKAELHFVERYLSLERLRFGARLNYRLEVPEALLDVELPSFCLQILVENAVRHGAEHNPGTTTVVISAHSTETHLILQVQDDGLAQNDLALGARQSSGLGSGLNRLRERLHWLYQDDAQLHLERQPQAMLARLHLPLEPP